MYFKRIEMHGFKSFAEPVTIEFDKGITCVVGPNGSGKSNISDAIRWVLGEQSPKMLRGGKMEDVIFAGTASRKSRGMAEVTLVIDNSTGILPIEYQEVAITRRMYRSGESEYAINNNQCRMKDIRELLMDTGIGVDGYSLIGQGKISDIISNKSDSIREIFEETAGIVSYRSKKAEAERKLASSNLNMDRVNDIILEIEGRIDSLREDSQKATEYINLRDRHKELEINITINNIEDIADKAKILSEDLKALTKELDTFASKRSEYDAKIDEARVKLDSFEVSIDEISRDLKEKTETINSLIGEKNVNRERLHAMEKDTLRITNEIKDIDGKIAEEEENGKKLIVQKQEIDKRHKELEKKLSDEIKGHSEAIDKKTELTTFIDQKKNDMFSLSNKKSGWIAEKNSLQRLAENLKESEEDLLLDKERGNEKYEVLLEEIENINIRREEIDKSIKELKNKKTALDIDRDLLKTENIDLQKKIQDLGITVGQNIARKKTIEEMESNYEGYNSGVKFVMKSEISGIEGVVAELITVPKGYELAMETALGATMQNIVCRDDKTAKKAVNLLKEKKAGRVTLLPVESIKARNVLKEAAIESEEGFIGYGVECISFDPRYKNIFEYLLGNVAIIDNMDNAIKISKKGNKAIKYVTLEGEIINTAGAVTGGKYKNKSANILERRSEIASLEKIISQEENEKNEAEKIREANTKKIEKLTASLEEIARDLRSEEVELLSITNRRENVSKEISTHEEEVLRWEVSLNNILEEKKGALEELDRLDNKILDAENEIIAIEKTIEDKAAKLGDMQGELEAAGEAITAARIQATACQGEKENIDNLYDILKENIKSYNEEKEDKIRQLENIKLDSQAINEGLNLREDKVAELTIEKERLENKLEQLTYDKSKYSKIYSESSVNREELNRQTTSLQNQKYDIDIKLARQESQLDNLKNKLWEDFEVSYAQALSMKAEEFAMSSAVRENRQIKNRIKELGEVNIGAIKEYAQVKERYEFLTEQRADIKKSTDELNKIISDMDKVIKEKFKTSFDQVVEHFESTFVEFFGGGHAKITLDNPDDPLNATIEITAQPPGKQLKNINLMSGGEKTMTAIALMFAVLKTKPTPCCILDEVEAALDDHNIHVFANYLKKFDDIQFTLITHQKTTMEHADVMYGVTMPERGISKVFSLKMGDELPV